MRVYFEKPRTTVGWKGLINDPDLDAASGSTRACASPVASCATSTSHARVLREAAHHGGLEGPDQRPGPGRSFRIDKG
ncbi:hypothetical protein C7E12_22170, partial [Stenotrophomonas maltophilia]